jgi:hypothetical protein
MGLFHLVHKSFNCEETVLYIYISHNADMAGPINYWIKKCVYILDLFSHNA